jgi:hypothetical protein
MARGFYPRAPFPCAAAAALQQESWIYLNKIKHLLSARPAIWPLRAASKAHGDCPHLGTKAKKPFVFGL